MRSAVLVTGGAGYVGSHIAWLLMQHGYEVIIVDNFCQQQRCYLTGATVVEADFGNKQVLADIFQKYSINAVIHCAAYTQVAASVQDPLHYYENNLLKTGILLATMIEHGIKRILFSSSCAVYGLPIAIPMSETHPCNPISPYGATKAMVERMLADYAHAYGLHAMSLRYFNAAGAHPEYNLGEQHLPETHIIPLLLQAMHERRPFMLFGNDYATPDGSCIRDFLHVIDIAYAHLIALTSLDKYNAYECFNLGTGVGVSIKQLVKAAEQLFDIPIKLVVADRRAGDPDCLVADPYKAMQLLGWKPRYSDINHILRSAYTYMLKEQELGMKLCLSQSIK